MWQLVHPGRQQSAASHGMVADVTPPAGIINCDPVGWEGSLFASAWSRRMGQRVLSNIEIEKSIIIEIIVEIIIKRCATELSCLMRGLRDPKSVLHHARMTKGRRHEATQAVVPLSHQRLFMQQRLSLMLRELAGTASSFSSALASSQHWVPC